MGLRPVCSLSLCSNKMSEQDTVSLVWLLGKEGEEGGTQPALNVQGLRYFGSFCVFNPKDTNQAVVATKTLGYSI